jgi:hypothetical protein
VPGLPAGGFGDRDRTQLTQALRSLTWLELALRVVLGPQRSAEIDALVDAATEAAYAGAQTDLVGAFAGADLTP